MPLILPRLPRNVALIDGQGKPTLEFQRWWNTLANNLETSFDGLADTVAAVAAAQAAADAANAAAASADAAAVAAQDAADAVTSEQALVNSYVTGLTLSATDAGANATVNISAHTRVYGDGTSLSVGGGSLTGLAYSTRYLIYYVDATRADTTPTYLSTTSEATAAQTGDTHLVGSVTTPAAAAPDTDGATTRPPGVGTLLE